ncbi:hypothetical protein [Mesorhizobium sp. Cs1321R2N1]|uniref:hypothetical protein n=1 Tax=Mesorhizobium sp. Cs1321R2N1 TaxID=3015174 RepID=UPI00301D6763
MKAKALAAGVVDTDDGDPMSPSWTDRQAFTKFKFQWLDQVACDAELPPVASRIAILLADRFLSYETGDAWPGVPTLAGLLQISSTRTVQNALIAMQSRGHVSIDVSAGGRKQTNRYAPTLMGDIPCKNLQGFERSEARLNPAKLSAETLQNPARKPRKKLHPNPYEGIPLKEPGAGLPKAAPAHVSRSHSTSVPRDDSGASASRAPVVYHPDGFNVGVEVDVVGEGTLIIRERVGDLMMATGITGEQITFRRVEGLMNVVSRRRERFQG